MTWKIVTDSGCDIKHIEAIADHTEFQNVPLTIQIGSEIFVDDEGLDVDNMMASVYASPYHHQNQVAQAQMPSYKPTKALKMSLLLRLQEIYQEVKTALKWLKICFLKNTQMLIFM